MLFEPVTAASKAVSPRTVLPETEFAPFPIDTELKVKSSPVATEAGNTVPSLGVPVDCISPNITAKNVVLATGAVVKTNVEPDIVKSVSGSCITPPNDNNKFLAVPGNTAWLPAVILKLVVDELNPLDIWSSLMYLPTTGLWPI